MCATPGRRITAVVAAAGLSLLGCADDAARDEASSEPAATVGEEAVGDVTPATAEAAEPPGDSSASTKGSLVDITVVGVPGYAGGDLAGIVERDADGLVVGGFATTIDDGDFTTTQRVLVPAERDGSSEAWPQLTDEAAALTPGEYVLTVWVDTGLGRYTRWYPMNTDAHGLAGCVYRFSVGDEMVTEITVGGDVRSTGYFGVCEPSAVPSEDEAFVVQGSIVDPDRRAVSAPFTEVGDDPSGIVQELLVWRGEFLAIGRVDHPQPLPAQLPPEIAEQFPPEIQDLFPDGLPPTLDEAIAVISDAGLLTEAEAAVGSIPGAYDAVFGLDPVPPTWRFAGSADGTDWADLDATVPDEVAVILDAATSGDQLVVVGHRATSGIPPIPSEIAVAWTRDLESWTISDLALESPPDLPDDAVLSVVDASVAANAIGWLATARVTVIPGDTELPSDPSPELAAYLQTAGWGFAPVVDQWFATWDGDPAVTDPAGTGRPSIVDGVVVATRTGFVHVAADARYTDDDDVDVARYTDDGTNWTTRMLLPADISVDPWATFVQPISDGFVISFGRSFDEGAPAVYRVDETAQSWTPIEVPELPGGLGPAQMTDGAGYVLDTYWYDDEFGQWLVATPDGERWIVEEYNSFESTDDPDTYEPRVAAMLDGTLLFGNAEFGADRWWSVTW